MLDFAYVLHFHNRYLVLLIGLLTMLYALAGLVRKGPVDRVGLGMLRAFAVVADVQFVLGILTLITRAFFPALIGHLVLMIAAIAVLHLGTIRLKQSPAEMRSWNMLLLSALIPFALMIAGILAIGRPLV